MELNNYQILLISCGFVFTIGCATIYFLKSKYMKLMADNYNSNSKSEIEFNFRSTEAFWVLTIGVIVLFIVGLFGLSNNESAYIDSLEKNKQLKEKIEALEYYKEELKEDVQGELLKQLKESLNNG